LKTKLLAIVIIIAIVATAFTYFDINYNADWHYNREFGTYVLVATQSSSLNRTWANTLIVWQNMNATFDQSKFNTTYNVIPVLGLNADLKYENTLAAENDYFQGLQNLYIDDLTILKQNTGFNSEMNLVYEYRNEANANGGMDWAIKGAYYIQNYPLAYWSWIIYAIIWALAVVGIVIALVLEG
jgi:hypothetical protein